MKFTLVVQLAQPWNCHDTVNMSWSMGQSNINLIALNHLSGFQLLTQCPSWPDGSRMRLEPNNWWLNSCQMNYTVLQISTTLNVTKLWISYTWTYIPSTTLYLIQHSSVGNWLIGYKLILSPNTSHFYCINQSLKKVRYWGKKAP